jgi:hypothetical protein
MACLLDLPNELLTDIAEQLQGHQPYQLWPNARRAAATSNTLRALTLTCSRLRYVAQSILLRTICIYDHGDEFATASGTLFRLGVQREIINVSLKEVEAPQNAALGETEQDTRGYPEFPPAMMDMLSHVTNLHLRGTTFVQAIRNSARENSISNGLSASDIRAVLPHLHTLFIRPELGPDSVLCIADVATLMQLPGLVEIRIHGGVLLYSREHWWLNDPEDFLPGSIHAAKLILVGCLLDQVAADLLFGACTGLRILKYSQFHRPNGEIEEALGLDGSNIYTFSTMLAKPHTISRHLARFQETLEELHLNFMNFGQFSSNFSNLSGLKNLSHVHALNIQAWYLKGFDDLPPNLKHLTLQVNSISSLLPQGRREFVCNMDGMRDTHYPCLKSVIFHTDREKSTWIKHKKSSFSRVRGKWEDHGEPGKQCCYSWVNGDVSFTYRSILTHGAQQVRWQSPLS